jgi:hypothetical protein
MTKGVIITSEVSQMFQSVSEYNCPGGGGMSFRQPQHTVTHSDFNAYFAVICN